MTELSREEVLRYSRHLILPDVGLAGQKRLKEAKVLCVGAGGLGSPLAMYLAAAGVGTIGVVDFDVVDASNLHRQVLHGTGDIGRRKVESARETIADLNPHVNVVLHETRLTSENALEILASYDLVADGTDNFATRYLVNDACVLLGKPNVYGSVFRFEGQASVFAHADGPCYRCLYPEPPPPGLVPSCAEGGVLGILPGVVGLIQATEAVKLLVGIGESLVGRLLMYDALAMTFRELRVRKDPACPVCGANPTITALVDYEAFCGVAGPEERSMDDGLEIEPLDLKRRMDGGEDFLLVDVRNPDENVICRIQGAQLIPLRELPDSIHRLDDSKTVVVHCHHGMRAAQAVQFLRSVGFRRVLNLRGGIDAWSLEVDPQVPRY
jgi:adenylyltransferase/sulfurtransferase